MKLRRLVAAVHSNYSRITFELGCLVQLVSDYSHPVPADPACVFHGAE